MDSQSKPQSTPKTKHRRTSRRQQPKNTSSSSNSTSTSSSIPSHLLTPLFNACQSIDHTLSSSQSQQSQQQPPTHTSFDPYTYLTSPSQVQRWEIGLLALSNDYLHGKITPEEYEGVVGRLLEGLARFVEVKSELEGQLGGGEGMGVFWDALGRRERVFEEVLGGLAAQGGGGGEQGGGYGY